MADICPKKDGFRIKTTAKKLASILYNKTVQLSISQHAFHKCFIGKVLYCTQEELHDQMEDNEGRLKAISDPSGKASAQGFLLKRTAFSHEEEVRAIYCSVGDPDKNMYSDVVLFDVDPDAFIDEICLDPRMLFNAEEEIRRLKDRGVTLPIICSDLYAPPSDDVLWKMRK